MEPAIGKSVSLFTEKGGPEASSKRLQGRIHPTRAEREALSGEGQGSQVDPARPGRSQGPLF